MTIEQRKEDIQKRLSELSKTTESECVDCEQIKTCHNICWDCMEKLFMPEIQRLEEIIKAADEVVQRGYSPGSVDTSGFGENDKYYEALEHYNKLKSKLPSGI